MVIDFVSTERYDQHHPEIADGLDGLGAAFAAWTEQGKKIVYGKIHRVIAEGNFVLVVAEGVFDVPVAFWDLFRVADSKNVEHWDGRFGVRTVLHAVTIGPAGSRAISRGQVRQ